MTCPHFLKIPCSRNVASKASASNGVTTSLGSSLFGAGIGTVLSLAADETSMTISAMIGETTGGALSPSKTEESSSSPIDEEL